MGEPLVADRVWVETDTGKVELSAAPSAVADLARSEPGGEYPALEPPFAECSVSGTFIAGPGLAALLFHLRVHYLSTRAILPAAD